MRSTRSQGPVEAGSGKSSRKRRAGSISCSDIQSPAPRRRGDGSLRVLQQPDKNESAGRESAYTTPRKSRKRVRFSDPGPQLQDDHGSTGLTPAIMRTSFEDSDMAHQNRLNRTPTRLARRRSTPIMRSRRSIDPSPSETPLSERVVQFLPLRQMLDPRTQRRIRRGGLSDEIIQIEREKREATTFEKTLEALRRERYTQDAEIERLKQQLEQYSRSGSEDMTAVNERTSTSTEGSIQVSGAETSQFVRDSLTSSTCITNSHLDRASSYEDMFTVNDTGIENDTVMASDSPDFRPLTDRLAPVPDDLSLLRGGHLGTDASTQACIPDENQEVEFRALSRDLEAARKEKANLFEAWRAHISSKQNATDDVSRPSSPPSDFLSQIVPTLATALTRASDAADTLDVVRQELSSLGFSGNNVGDIISEMRCHFRSSRLELERAVPGETANCGLENGKATLDALVKRVRLLAKDLEDEHERHNGTLGREKALRGQFDALLVRYESASKRVSNLEETISSSASDMLHTRMRMHELERESKEQTLGIDRLNAALDKYRDEVKSLEALVTSLEVENAACKASHSQQITELENKLAAEEKTRHDAESQVTKHEARIRELEESVEQNRIRVCDLIAKVESLEKERQKALEVLEQQADEERQHHEHEIGSMNVRISELTTSLEDTKSEMERLRRTNAGLEEQLSLEVKAKDQFLDRWIAHQERASAWVKETVNAERRRAKVRAANWELQSDDIQSDSTHFGSEPITPVSVARFVDVEVGRGKQRRRLDSGIGILTEEEELMDDDGEQELPRCLDSDIGLPTSD